MHHLQLSRICPSSKIIELGWLIGNLQGFSNMACSQYAMSPIDSEMNQSWIPDLVGCHGLVEIHGYPGVEKVSWSQQVLHVISSQQLE